MRRRDWTFLAVALIAVGVWLAVTIVLIFLTRYHEEQQWPYLPI